MLNAGQRSRKAVVRRKCVVHFTMNSSSRGALLQYGHPLVAVRQSQASYILREKTHIITAADIRREKSRMLPLSKISFSDILGTMKSNRNSLLQIEQLDKGLVRSKICLRSSIEGFVRINESNMYLCPDLDTCSLPMRMNDVAGLMQRSSWQRRALAGDPHC